MVEKRSNKCATFFSGLGRANFFTYLKEILRSFVRTVGVVFASAGDGKIVTWNIPAANTRQTISVRRTTRPSSLPRRHVSAMSMIIGPESSGSAMARVRLSRFFRCRYCRSRGTRAHQCDRGAASVDRSMDLSRSRRTHSSYRARRARPQTVSLSRPMAKRARRLRRRPGTSGK